MQIPQDWTSLLLSVRAVCPTAVLAGGALRDLDNGKPVKDLDIFVTAANEKDVTVAVAALEAAGFEVSYDFGDECRAYPEDQNLEVIQVATLHHAALDVQIIFTNWDTSQIVERFDYGVCRLSWDGVRLVRPPEYDEDKAAKVFRLRRDRPTPVSMRGSIRRFARLTADKFRGWDWWPYEPDGEFDFLCAVNG